ncbi:hypothetical protein TrLO_g14898 [Triparma laevis f. longispina]|uniref:Uncharacterized protein n=1 Tax=Triparma laevis f. longispina TaxID=1714387 RepID=A0A9W7FT16_9STRA|nr:hypothetical protein TrLO_g14898 [Triparma laevis f. longispina]
MDGLADYSDSDSGGDEVRVKVPQQVKVDGGAGAAPAAAGGALNGLVGNYSDSDDDGDADGGANGDADRDANPAKRLKLAAGASVSAEFSSSSNNSDSKYPPLSPSSKRALETSIVSIKSSIAQGKGDLITQLLSSPSYNNPSTFSSLLTSLHVDRSKLNKKGVESFNIDSSMMVEELLRMQEEKAESLRLQPYS